MPLVVIFGETSKQDILGKNVKVGTMFEVGTSSGVILHFVFSTSLEVGTNLEVCTHYKATSTGGASGGHFRQNF